MTLWEPTKFTVLQEFPGFYTLQRVDFEKGEQKITRDFLETSDAVAIVPFNDQGQVGLIRQFRAPINQRLWELPAGRLDVATESISEAAARELREEMDLEAGQWNYLGARYSSPGILTEKIHFYLARDLSAVSTFKREDEEADIIVSWASPSVAIFHSDAHTSLGVLLAQQFLSSEQ